MRSTILLIAFLGVPGVRGADEFTVKLRSRTETALQSGRYHSTETPATWPAAKTAVVVCDMWDKHWCDGATARVGELVPRMNRFLTEARKRGALIIHCPSDTMAFYKDTPQRKLAQAAPPAKPKVPLESWCRFDPAREGKLPIDDSDGGCAESSKSFKAWTRQHPGLTIADSDAITDSAEAYNLMRQRGIENVFVMGVHTNMCVLGRPFAIRQLTKQGMNVALVRDLTDTMYNPARSPFVSHFTGTDLVVEHIEQFWCPSVTSADLLGGTEFRFKDDRRPHLVIVSAEDEYKTETTLPAFALKELGMQYRISTIFADAKNKHHLPGLAVLKNADAVILSVRRRPLLETDLAAIRAFVESGKPVIALRTSSHAFAPKKGESLPAGVVTWEKFDQEILGCQYTGHYSNKETTAVTPAGAQSVCLKNVTPFTSPSWLYKSKPLAADCVVLLEGKAGTNPAEPAAWIRERKESRGRVFYTCLGHPGDFEIAAFRTLLKNSIAWAIPTSLASPQ